jgi:hypothetical protein
MDILLNLMIVCSFEILFYFNWLFLVIYSIHLTAEDESGINDSPIYIAINEETVRQHTFAVEEKKEWNFNEIETFRSIPIIEDFASQQEQSM